MLGCVAARGDEVTLKNGNVLNGTYRGGTATIVSFEAFGNVMQIATSDIASLTFTTSPPPAAPPPPTPAASAPAAAAAAAAPAAGPKEVTLPAGTTLLVRMKDSISSNNAAGTPFTTRLEYDLFASGVKVVPAGSIIYGKVQSSTQARRVRGQSTLDIRLTQISVPGGPVPITSSAFQEAGERAIKDAARGTAAGAAIGAVADGTDGAQTGAAIGVVAGALKKGESIVIPPNTMLEFTLTQPVTITVGG